MTRDLHITLYCNNENINRIYKFPSDAFPQCGSITVECPCGKEQFIVMLRMKIESHLVEKEIIENENS